MAIIFFMVSCIFYGFHLCRDSFFFSLWSMFYDVTQSERDSVLAGLVCCVHPHPSGNLESYNSFFPRIYLLSGFAHIIAKILKRILRSCFPRITTLTDKLWVGGPTYSVFMFQCQALARIRRQLRRVKSDSDTYHSSLQMFPWFCSLLPHGVAGVYSRRCQVVLIIHNTR